MTTTPSTCRKCGAEPREGARFCDACGAPISSGDEAEYKQVTVLFADVVRSMDMVATLGPERMREVMTELVNRSAAVVRRYGGTLNQFTGDGIMALFGAPKSLEDHARRACLAALGIQQEVQRLAADVTRSDGVDLSLRIGLNSGQVIAGDVASSSIGYTAIGEHVGMAQRMESVAPPGGVMLSESTARLVEGTVALGEGQFVRIKGSEHQLPARRLLGAAGERQGGKRESALVGREWEKGEIEAVLDRAINGSGGVVAVSGSPGIGKSRLVRESVRSAQARGINIFATYCESHTRDISFHVISRLLRAVFEVDRHSHAETRARIRGRLGHVDRQDLLLLDDLLGIYDTDVPLPDISPDARRRRLVDLINSSLNERRRPAIYVVEDVHWIDTVSEAMLADFVAVVSQTRSAVLMTYRPEYRGALSRLPGSQLITLAPLDNSRSSQLTSELLGPDPSVASLSALIVDRAAGVPLFAEEIIRDLAERGILVGDPGSYVCVDPVQDIDVPATLQATIGARIDRLDASAKKTLHAAAIIGAHFDVGLLRDLVADGGDVAPLLDAGLVDQVSVEPHAEYVFHHPLIQKVAYESQLRSARSALHRRLAGALERDSFSSADENAALIATQWEAAGDFRKAFEWHMRAGAWFHYRDYRAAHTSWQRARDAADQVAANDPDRLAMQISPRRLICATTFRTGGTAADTGFDQLQELTTTAGDKTSLAIGMAGYLTTLAFRSHHREASRMASEFVSLVESIGDRTMTVGLLPAAAHAKYEAGEMSECVEIAEHVIELAEGDEAMGNIMVASPLSWAITLRGAAKMCLGRPGWLNDLNDGLAMALPLDIQSACNAALYKYVLAIQSGAVLSDETGRAYTEEWLEGAEQTGDPTAIALARLIRGVTLTHAGPQRQSSGIDLLTSAYDQLSWLSAGLRRMADVEIARHNAATGDLDGAIATAERILNEAFDTGEMFSRGATATVLVEALLRRGRESDLAAAREAIDRLAAVPTEPGYVIHELPLLRLRALLARAQNDEERYRQFATRFRAKAHQVEFAGCLAQADALQTERESPV